MWSCSCESDSVNIKRWLVAIGWFWYSLVLVFLVLVLSEGMLWSRTCLYRKFFHSDFLKAPFYNTAVKGNALAELMNRASKMHWKNLSLTLNGRNSETKNDKNNPKVPKFLSCRGLSSTLSRKCGSTTLCGCLWVFRGCLWVFLGVCGC